MSSDSNVILANVLEDIVDSIRETGTIDNVSVSNGISTVISENSLNEGDVVTINEVDYVTLSVSSSQFTIKGDVTGQSSWKAKAPYYMYDTTKKIRQRLQEKDKSPTEQYQKYPLIALVEGYTYDRTNSEVYAEVSPTLVIVDYTDRNYDGEERYDNVITPILLPIYDDLLVAIFESLNFWFDTELTEPRHLMTIILHYGDDGNTNNKYADHLDAIEIGNLELKIKYSNNC